jgi:Spy/CpxP family protein refolding chaperone
MTLLAISFALGLLVGGASLAIAARSGKSGWLRPGDRGGKRPEQGDLLAQRLQLDLARPVRDSITAIWQRRDHDMDSIYALITPGMDSLYQQIRPAVETRRTQTRTDIGALLTPAQRVKYDSMNRADDERRKQMRDQGLRGGPPGKGGPGGGPGSRGGFDRGPH